MKHNTAAFTPEIKASQTVHMHQVQTRYTTQARYLGRIPSSLLGVDLKRSTEQRTLLVLSSDVLLPPLVFLASGKELVLNRIEGSIPFECILALCWYLHFLPLVPKAHYQSMCIAIKQLGFEYWFSRYKIPQFCLFGESNKTMMIIFMNCVN